jgi:dihydrofolate synthase/folylpolyglutamate synthase
MTYDESVRYLLTLGRELASPQQARAAKFDLHNIRVLSAHLGNSHDGFPSVHIAGTNGKGSTAAMLAGIFHAAGLRAGLYTSPHLVRINERIRMAEADISDDDFAATFTRVHTAIEELLATGALAAHPTYFECLTAMAFDYFARQKADIAVIEVGMGGRLDSTNIIHPLVAVITRIDFDHENFLGHSIEEIASEKAGIIKRGTVVVNAAGHPAANEVIRRRVQELGARLIEVDSAYSISGLSSHEGRHEFVVVAQDAPAELVGGPEAIHLRESQRWQLRIALPLPGRFQIQNALTAIAAVRLLAERRFRIPDAAIARGLSSVRWPGRLQKISETPAIFLDGTHNPAGARELLAFWDDQFSSRRVHLIYGAMRDKPVDEIAGLLFPRAATVIVTCSPQPRSISAEALASLTRHLATALEVIPDPAAALERAVAIAGPGDVVFATGSLYLAGDLLRYWHDRSSGCAPAAVVRHSAR